MSTLSADQLTTAKQAKEVSDTSSKSEMSEMTNDAAQDGTDSYQTQGEYVADRIVRHAEEKGETKFVGRLYGCTATDDSVVSAAHITRHFIDRYRKRASREITAGDDNLGCGKRFGNTSNHDNGQFKNDGILPKAVNIYQESSEMDGKASASMNENIVTAVTPNCDVMTSQVFTNGVRNNLELSISTTLAQRLR